MAMDMVASNLRSSRQLTLPLPPKLSTNLKRFRVHSSSSQLSLSPNLEKTLSLIHNSGVIACLRANSAELAFEAASAALSGGVSVLEIVMSTPGVFQVLRQLVEDHPSVALGVGTVLNAEDARNAKNAGARFLMSPAMVMGIMDVVQDSEVLYIPGVMTPTEILSAYDAGAKIVKVYPVSALGGTQYISALKKPFPHISVVASQGIMIESVGDYISCGASSVVLSDAIFNKEAMAQKNFNKKDLHPKINCISRAYSWFTGKDFFYRAMHLDWKRITEIGLHGVLLVHCISSQILSAAHPVFTHVVVH